MPWNYRPWGCGAGPRGSCNNGWIQFEICEDALTDRAYFEAAYKEACELTAYLCTIFNLDPYGYADNNGVRVPVLLCHADSCNLGLGSNHGDIYHWSKKFGKDMTTVRKDVAALMGKTAPVNPPVDNTERTLYEGLNGDDVKVIQEQLIELGYSCGDDGADGYFGPMTAAAVIKFQKDKGLEADGYVGPLTKAALTTAINNKKATVEKRLLGPGMNGEDVKAVQKQLIFLDYSCGPDGADGYFGNDTQSAVIKFQKDHKLTADGWVGKETYPVLDTAVKAKELENKSA